jgi:hypothetical protein
MYSGKIPFIRHLRIFGSLTYLYVSKEDRKKLDSKTKKCLLVGYDDESKTYRLYNNTRKKIN